MVPKSNRLRMLRVGAAVWLALICCGAMALTHYSQDGQRALNVPATLPEEVVESFDGKPYSLVMFVHPKCPCTRSAINELARLMSASDSRISATVFCFQPSGQAESWCRTDLWDSAAGIPDVTVRQDVDAGIAEQMSADISGQTFVYRADGCLVFSGGITAGRGHEGDSVGKLAILNVVKNQRTGLTTSPVFGCAIYRSTETDVCGDESCKSL